MGSECIFCQIISGQLPANIEYQDEKVVAFRDIHPKAKFHLLIVPKKHVLDIASADASLLTSILAIIKKFKVSDYKIEINGGSLQEVKHLHVHLLSERGL